MKYSGLDNREILERGGGIPSLALVLRLAAVELLDRDGTYAALWRAYAGGSPAEDIEALPAKM